MRKIFLTVLPLILSVFLYGQGIKSIVGEWYTQDNDSKITISHDASGKFNGKITWLKDPLNDQGRPKVDDKNPDKKLMSQPILGLRLLSGFEYNAKDKRWENGTIYDPQSGKTYKCLMWISDNPNKLSVKGYIGFSLIGREVVWTRAK